MSARTNGKAYFQVDESKDVENLTDRAMRRVLQTLQAAIALLVDQGNDAALQAMQSCTGELFRQAAECRQQNKKMEVV